MKKKEFIHVLSVIIKRRRKDVVQACCKSDPPEMSVAVLLGIVGPGPEKLWVEGLNLHEKL